MAAMLAELLPQLIMRYLGKISYIEDRAFRGLEGALGLAVAVQEALAARARQPGSVPARPGPVRLPAVRAVLQDDPSDRVQLPAHPGQVRQAQVPRGVSGEPGHPGRQRDPPHHLRPGS